MSECACGCGGKTSIIKGNDRWSGLVKGEHRRYILGHANRGKATPESVRERLRAIQKARHPLAPHERILRRSVRVESGCLEFMGARGSRGYGRVRFGGGTHQTHRVVYEALVGAIPDGWHLHHQCENPACVEVEHLTPMHPRDHRRTHAYRTHCANGHELTGENMRIYVRPDGEVNRVCRACERIRKGRAA